MSQSIVTILKTDILRGSSAERKNTGEAGTHWGCDASPESQSGADCIWCSHCRLSPNDHCGWDLDCCHEDTLRILLGHSELSLKQNIVQNRLTSGYIWSNGSVLSTLLLLDAWCQRSGWCWELWQSMLFSGESEGRNTTEWGKQTKCSVSLLTCSKWTQNSPWVGVPHPAGGSRARDPLWFGVSVVPGFLKWGLSFDAPAL